MKTYYGVKQAMSQVWTESGLRLPVTIIKTEPLVVTQVKTVENDGYNAIQVGIGNRREKTITMPEKGHLKGVGTVPQELKEIRLDAEAETKVGDAIQVDSVVKVGDIVNVTGASKGRGFSGGMKRWGFHGGPKTHGQSDRWRAPGSIGQGTTPGRIYKGKRMAGRYGGETYQVKNLQIVHIDQEKNEIWVSGPVPGARNSVVTIEVTKEGKFEGLRSQTATES